MSPIGVKIGSLAAALVVAGSAAIGALPAHAQAGSCGDRVVIAFGDSLSQIARRCGTTVSAIMAVNPLLPSANFVFPGLTILMPQAVVPPPPPGPPSQGPVVRYTVRPGDTLSGIARMHNVALADIYRLNPDIGARTLRVGDIVRLPGGFVPPRPEPPVQGAIIRYVVRPGDTLIGIARAHAVTLADIYRLNPNIDARTLRVGDVVRLPGRGGPPAPVEPSVSLSAASGGPGSVVQVSAAGFPRYATLTLLAGREQGRLRELERVSTDARGRVTVNVRVPDWAAALRSVVFAFETADGRLRSVSAPFRIERERPPAGLDVTGTLTREGVECQAMRGDDGKLYTLSGNLLGFRPGDRVRVEGRVAEVSTCMQGTTIAVERIDEVR